LKIERGRWLPCAVQNAAASSADSRSMTITTNPAGAASVIDSLQQ